MCQAAGGACSLHEIALLGATIDSESLPSPDFVGLCDAAIRLTVQRNLVSDTDLLPLILPTEGPEELKHLADAILGNPRLHSNQVPNRHLLTVAGVILHLQVVRRVLNTYHG